MSTRDPLTTSSYDLKCTNEAIRATFFNQCVSYFQKKNIIQKIKFHKKYKYKKYNSCNDKYTFIPCFVTVWILKYLKNNRMFVHLRNGAYCTTFPYLCSSSKNATFSFCCCRYQGEQHIKFRTPTAMDELLQLPVKG